MFLWPIQRIKITGHSMEPTLPEGSFFLLNRWVYFFRSPRLGEVVVLQSDQEFLCKRIAGIDLVNEEYQIEGDNSRDSLDSRKLGPIQKKQILGKVIFLSH